MNSDKIVQVNLKGMANVSHGIRFVIDAISNNNLIKLVNSRNAINLFPGNYGFSLRKYVLVVHDLIGLRPDYPQNYLMRLARFVYMFVSVLFSEVTIVISETTQKKLIRAYPILKKSKIVVVKNQTEFNEFFSKSKEPSFQMPREGYFLCVANSMPHKGVGYLLSILDDVPHLPILLVGNYDSNTINTFKSKKNIFIGFVENEVLSFLMKNMTGLLVPSLDEGFSIPAAMAMSIGKPLLLNDIQVFRELYGEYAVFYSNESELSTKINTFYLSDYVIPKNKLGSAHVSYEYYKIFKKCN